MQSILTKVISGGQTGVDRAGLDWGEIHCLPIGGYCPDDCRAEDGTVPERYGLIPLESGGYRERTEANVVASDGTLVLNTGALSGGTQMTVSFAKKHGKPYLLVQLDEATCVPPEECLQWLRTYAIHCLNIAGPRASKTAGIYDLSRAYLEKLWCCMEKQSL